MSRWRSWRRRSLSTVQGLRNARWPALVLLTVVVAAAILVLLLWLPDWLVDRASDDSLTDAEQVKAVTEERRTILAAIAGVGAAVTLWYTAQRQRLDRDANRTDRYTKAVEQLGDDEKPAVQLGGVYALERVALDSPRDRRVAFEVLSAFIRQQAAARTQGEPSSGGQKPGWAGSPSEPMLAALTALGRRELPLREEQPADLHGIEFAGVQLARGLLRNANLGSADLRGANLRGADLAGANLRRANLTGADLRDTDLTGANLGRANLISANLTGAELISADLSGATLRDAHLTVANLTGADLTGANLSGANLTGANLRRAVLDQFTEMPNGWERVVKWRPDGTPGDSIRPGPR